MFADDTNLFYASTSITELYETANTELEKINSWLKSNKLSLNTEKTKYILFHSNLKKIPPDLPSLNIDAKEIERTQAIKFLGILIDETISWKSHIDLLITKISKNIGILFKASSILSPDNLKFLYFSLIQSYYIYANVAWASTHKSKLTTLYRKQKHAARIVFNKDRLSHAEPLLKNLKALNVYQINIFQNLLFMIKYKLGLVPSHFSKNFFKNSKNRYDTRETGNFYIPFKKTNLSRFSILYRGPSLYNKLISKNTQLEKLNNINTLKIILKDLMLNTNNFMKFY